MLLRFLHVFTLVLACLIASCQQKNASDNERITYFKNGKMKSIATVIDGILDGPYTSWYRDGKKHMEGNYKNGVRDGAWTEYEVYLTPQHPNDRHAPGSYIETTYKNGKKFEVYSCETLVGHSLFKYRENFIYFNGKDTVWRSIQTYGRSSGIGQISSENFRINNKIDSISSSWDTNGNLVHQRDYRNLSMGISIWYDENGKKRNGSRTTYFKNGQLHSSMSFKDGLWQGKREEWHRTGEQWLSLYYVDGKQHGLQQTWYENGHLSHEENYKSGNKHGRCREWYENGILHEEAYYDNYEYHGKRTFWDKKGRKYREKIYDHGTLVSEKTFD